MKFVGSLLLLFALSACAPAVTAAGAAGGSASGSMASSAGTFVSPTPVGNPFDYDPPFIRGPGNGTLEYVPGGTVRDLLRSGLPELPAGSPTSVLLGRSGLRRNSLQAQDAVQQALLTRAGQSFIRGQLRVGQLTDGNTVTDRAYQLPALTAGKDPAAATLLIACEGGCSVRAGVHAQDGLSSDVQAQAALGKAEVLALDLPRSAAGRYDLQLNLSGCAAPFCVYVAALVAAPTTP